MDGDQKMSEASSTTTTSTTTTTTSTTSNHSFAPNHGQERKEQSQPANNSHRPPPPPTANSNASPTSDDTLSTSSNPSHPSPSEDSDCMITGSKQPNGTHEPSPSKTEQKENEKAGWLQLDTEIDVGGDKRMNDLTLWIGYRYKGETNEERMQSVVDFYERVYETFMEWSKEALKTIMDTLGFYVVTKQKFSSFCVYRIMLFCVTFVWRL